MGLNRENRVNKRDHVFTLPVRVYFQDTDAGGVVYHASYVNFMERARTEWLRSFGYTGAGLMSELGVMFVVRSLKLDYLKPAQLDDLLTVSAQLKEIGRSRVTLHQTVMRDEDKLVEAEIHLISVSVEHFKPVSVPEALREQWKVGV
jgi:acyl-CoA thioester hydrolase